MNQTNFPAVLQGMNFYYFFFSPNSSSLDQFSLASLFASNTHIL